VAGDRDAAAEREVGSTLGDRATSAGSTLGSIEPSASMNATMSARVWTSPVCTAAP
jgi:hypothetical protein